MIARTSCVKESYYNPGNEKPYDVYDYSYDTAGNLLRVTKNGTVIQTYTYGDAQWHDLLTAVNGQAIPDDASGNPLSYGGWSFGWQNGRQLKTASKTSDGKTETLEYAYDADGIRTSKTLYRRDVHAASGLYRHLPSRRRDRQDHDRRGRLHAEGQRLPRRSHQDRLYRRVGEVYHGNSQAMSRCR